MYDGDAPQIGATSTLFGFKPSVLSASGRVAREI
jgi:hypothetical protein